MEDSVVAMNGGDGHINNSTYQADIMSQGKVMLSNGIQEHLTIQDYTNSKPTKVFTIADLGCSVGPNTFSCVNTMIEAVKSTILKIHGSESQVPEFHVFFNDNVSNDFNTLFKNLPLEREYMAAGSVPGSFHGRLFPEASMNLMVTSIALHFLTKVPEEVTKMGSPAWNRGRITYVDSSLEVAEAYTAQFVKDIEAFLVARTVEMANGGLLSIIMPCRPEGTLPSEANLMHLLEGWGYALADMVKEGIVSEALLDSFNIPIYVPTPTQVIEVVSSVESLSVEKIDEVHIVPRFETHDDVVKVGLNIRAAVEGMLCKQFGTEVMEELFHKYVQKVKEFSEATRYACNETFDYLFLLVKVTK